MLQSGIWQTNSSVISAGGAVKYQPGSTFTMPRWLSMML